MNHQRKIANKQEKRILKSLQEIQQNIRQTINSGALWFQKSDLVSEKFRIEAKTKDKPSKQITIKKEWLNKIEREAFETNKIGLLVFSFGDGKDYVALNMNDFIELLKNPPQIFGGNS